MEDKILFPKEKIIEGDYFEINQDWEVPIVGFFILAPKRKIRSISEFNENESKEFMDLLIKVRKGMKEVLNIDDVYLFQNEDTKHNFHLWIFPRHAWMEEFGRKIQSVGPIMNYAVEKNSTKEKCKEVKDAAEKIRQYLR
jgi:diadenosine tetraphosphate (Ap4A) HIT family hydrolase